MRNVIRTLIIRRWEIEMFFRLFAGSDGGRKMYSKTRESVKTKRIRGTTTAKVNSERTTRVRVRDVFRRAISDDDEIDRRRVTTVITRHHSPVPHASRDQLKPWRNYLKKTKPVSTSKQKQQKLIVILLKIIVKPLLLSTLNNVCDRLREKRRVYECTCNIRRLYLFPEKKKPNVFLFLDGVMSFD